MNANKKISFAFKLRQFLNGSMYDADKAHYMWRLYFDSEDRVRILGETHRELVYDTDPYKLFHNHYNIAKDLDWLDRHLYVDCMTWLTDDILVKVDRTTMHNSIEARAPYLDFNLAEYAASIPSHYKIKGNETKYILKKALNPILPSSTLRKKKSGFNAPVGKWLSNGELDEFKTFNKFVFQRKIKYAEKAV
jgi:asparagine synthase (glutamine-hydrolysing)